MSAPPPEADERVPHWLRLAAAASRQPPLRPRTPLWLAMDAGEPIPVGSVEPDVMQAGLRGVPPGLIRAEPGWGWVLRARGEHQATQALASLAQALREAGLSGPWRDEMLAVCGPDGQQVATLERGLVRVLGVATRAVHLVGWADATPEGRPDAAGCMWVQQRAHDKPHDPGRWDTLMGGMVPAHDDLHQALARETWEEAGLRLHDLSGLCHGGHVRIERPSSDAGGRGYMVEHIDWFEARVPSDLEPCNQDAEVDHFECWSRARLETALEQDTFTLEATLVLGQALRRV